MPLPRKTARIEITAYAEDIPRFLRHGYDLIGENEDCIATLRKTITLDCCQKVHANQDCRDLPEVVVFPGARSSQREFLFRSIGELAERLGIPGGRDRWDALASETAGAKIHA